MELIAMRNWGRTCGSNLKRGSIKNIEKSIFGDAHNISSLHFNILVFGSYNIENKKKRRNQKNRKLSYSSASWFRIYSADSFFTHGARI
jgi:hypothetical protein